MAIWKSLLLTYFSQLASKGKGTYKISGTRNAPLAHEGAEHSRNSFYFKYLQELQENVSGLSGDALQATLNVSGTTTYQT